MKRKFLILVPAILLCLVGCGKKEVQLSNNDEKEGQRICSAHAKDVINGYELDSTYTVNYKGIYAMSVESKEIVTSNNEDILSYFDETANSTYKTMNDTYGGYTYEITKEDDKVISSVTIDYLEMDLEKYVSDQPTYKAFIKNDKMLVEGLISIYKAAGATCDE